MTDWQSILEQAQSQFPDTTAVESLIDQVFPGRSVTTISRLRGGLGAVLHRIDLDPRPDDIEALVLRQLMPEWGETGVDLIRESTTLERLDRDDAVPVPSVYWSDSSGRVFGRPAMLMRFVEGHSLVADLHTPHASATLAATLATIHGASIHTEHLRRFERLADHPDILGINPTPSDVVDADALRAALVSATPAGWSDPCLVHGDFHGGNVLWDGTAVTAVLDWPLATVADRWWDEAYAFMDTWLAHGVEAAELFRAEYRKLAGQVLDGDRQRFWDLSALVRALPSPGQWLAAYQHAGATTLSGDVLERRYLDMVERVL